MGGATLPVYTLTKWSFHCPEIFTKLLKPPLTMLHKSDHISSGYIDDLYLEGETYTGCVANIIDTITLLEKLGFVIHPDKSALIPSQQLVALGFILNSVDMTVRLSREENILV